jgi:diguanylate cyclase (GGDEF)-like protein
VGCKISRREHQRPGSCYAEHFKRNNCSNLGPNADYPLPTDKLLAEKSSEKERDEAPFQTQQVISLLKLPNKEELLKDLKGIFEQHSVSAVIVIDLDHFKSVNDTNGHSAGDECLHKVVTSIGTVVGRKGELYRWGGDEFAVCLPDFSTEEAQVTIRLAIENARPGGEIVVTASIGICGTDRTDSNAAHEILDFADQAMYQSKRSGKNRVTSATLRS